MGTKSSFLTHFTKIPRVIWILGFSMFFVNISNVIVLSLSSVYMVTLGTSLLWIGILEGGIEAISFFMKLFSGVLSDYLNKRKNIILIGYGLTVLSMLMTGMARGYGMIFFARSLGRIGNGVQATPRDALVGDVAPEDKRASSYGLMRSLGVFGSILGSFLGVVAMMYTANNFNTVFYLATIPSIIALIILYICVKEPKHTRLGNSLAVERPALDRETLVRIQVPQTIKTSFKWSDLKLLDKKFWYLMGLVSVFMFAKFSEQWTTLVGYQKYHMAPEYVPLINVAFCTTYCLFSFPIGHLSDKIGRTKIFLAGILILMAGDIMIAYSTNLIGLFIGILLLGGQTGIAMNTCCAIISDIVPKKILGTAFGIYYFLSGISTVLAGIVGGIIANKYGIHFIFGNSFFICILCIGLLYIFSKIDTNDTKKEIQKVPL